MQDKIFYFLTEPNSEGLADLIVTDGGFKIIAYFQKVSEPVQGNKPASHAFNTTTGNIFRRRKRSLLEEPYLQGIKKVNKRTLRKRVVGNSQLEASEIFKTLDILEEERGIGGAEVIDFKTRERIA